MTLGLGAAEGWGQGRHMPPPRGCYHGQLSRHGPSRGPCTRLPFPASSGPLGDVDIKHPIWGHLYRYRL